MSLDITSRIMNLTGPGNKKGTMSRNVRTSYHDQRMGRFPCLVSTGTGTLLVIVCGCICFYSAACTVPVEDILSPFD